MTPPQHVMGVECTLKQGLDHMGDMMPRVGWRADGPGIGSYS